MTATKTRLPAFPSLTKVEMEDRKRSLLHDVDDLAPSRKRLKDERGDTMRMDDDKEKQVEVRRPRHRHMHQVMAVIDSSCIGVSKGRHSPPA